MYLFIIKLYNERFSKNNKKVVKWQKRKEGYSSRQIIIFSFSYATLARVRAALLHCNGTLIKEILWKLSPIKTISPRIEATFGGNFFSPLQY